MEIGFNNDVVYRGVTFHIQTEDHGGTDYRITTQLFHSGAIIDTKVVSYDSVVKSAGSDDERKSKIRKVMVKSHRSLYKRLFAGDYDGKLSDRLKDPAPAANEVVPAEDFQPSQQRVPEVAQVLEEDGKVTFTFDRGEEIDLAALSQQLSEIDIYGDEGRTGDGGDDNFDGLFAEFTGGGKSAPVAPQPAAYVQKGNEPPPKTNFRVRFRPTGRRAFRGLIEPDPSDDIFHLVGDFLHKL